MRLSVYFDKRNKKSFFVCEECYEYKETLKALGFRWDPAGKWWAKEYKTPTEVTTIFVDVMVGCDLAYEVFEDSLFQCDDLQIVVDENNFTAESWAKFYEKYNEE